MNGVKCDNMEEMQDYVRDNLNLFMDGFFSDLYQYIDNNVQFDISQYCEDREDEEQKKLAYEMSLNKQLLK